MQQSSDFDALSRVRFLVGSADVVRGMPCVPTLKPFDERMVSFLDDVSKRLLADRSSRQYSDVVTLGFWMRRASVSKLAERFSARDDEIRVGRGVLFHIAPSNVPVNFAYSLVAGLVCGNANVVRVPSKDFAQVGIVVRAINDVLSTHDDMVPYIALVRYGRDRDVNDALSSIASVRVVWGGDATINELRQSALPPRSTEVTFADRWSIAAIDSDAYLATGDKRKVAQGFYNDTYFSDQNACTSPRIVVWTGSRIAEAKEAFWAEEHALVAERYELQPVLAVNKLTSADLAAVAFPGCRVEPREDNLIVRVAVPELTPRLMDLRDNSGYFYEYDCGDILELRGLCNDVRCQTIGYLGSKDSLLPLIESGVRGVDRIVPIGKTMDFDLVWDGYDLVAAFTRVLVAE